MSRAAAASSATVIVCVMSALLVADRTAFAQAGSTGGTIGKTDKSVSGNSDKVEQPRREKDSHTSFERGLPRAVRGVIVVSATYGGNCGAPSGNMTHRLALMCNGKSHCDYVIDYQIIGDPKFLCSKDYVAEWRCSDGRTHNALVPPEAGYGKTISLYCD